jgi:vacuolar-type H+-ATPase subunit H
LNEKRIQEVIAIEKQADEVYAKAVKKAEQVPLQAEKEAKEIIEKTRGDAEKEAQDLIANAHPKEECEHILEDAEKQIHHNETLAKRHLDRAVTYVISRVLGRE